MAYKEYKGAVAGSDITSEISSTYIPRISGIRAANADITIDASSGYQIKGVKDPSDDQDVVTLKYLDDASYLTTSSASSTYLTQSSATSTYLTQSSASAVYLTQSNASGTYATQSYVQQQIEGIDPKEICEAATTADFGTAYTWSAGTFTEAVASGALSIDGVTLANDDRVLVKDESTKKQNGIYVVSDVDGSSNVKLTRATDADTVAGLVNAYTFVKTGGTSNGGKGFVQTTLAGSGTLNTSNIEFTQFTSSATSLTQEQVEDYAGALVASGGTKTGITVTYQDATGDMDFVVDHDAATNYVANEHIDWTASGAGTIHASNYTNTGTLTQEQVEDYVGGMVASNTETGIAVTYDDTNGKLNFVTDITTSNIGSFAVTSGTISNYAITSVVGTTDEISVSASSGTTFALFGGMQQTDAPESIVSSIW